MLFRLRRKLTWLETNLADKIKLQGDPKCAPFSIIRLAYNASSCCDKSDDCFLCVKVNSLVIIQISAMNQ